MEYFYRDMRKKYDIMMSTKNDPEGGKWNFDKSNRKKWTGKPEIPHERGFRKPMSPGSIYLQGRERVGQWRCLAFLLLVELGELP